MAKKYSPSGYQIINLGLLDLSSSITITDYDTEELKVLREVFLNFSNQNKKDEPIHVKPILLSITNSDSGISYCGFVNIVGDWTVMGIHLLVNPVDNAFIVLEYTVATDTLTISYTEL